MMIGIGIAPPVVIVIETLTLPLRRGKKPPVTIVIGLKLAVMTVLDPLSDGGSERGSLRR